MGECRGERATTLDVTRPTFGGKDRASFARPKRYGPRRVSAREEDHWCAVEFARLRLAFIPDAVQTAVLQSTAKRRILNCSRQRGKSTVVAAKAVHRAYASMRPESNRALCRSDHLRISVEETLRPAPAKRSSSRRRLSAPGLRATELRYKAFAALAYR